MKLKAKVSSAKKAHLPLIILKGSIVALLFSLASILIFAFVLKFTNISESVISPVNQIIKGVSVFFGVLFALKKQRELGLVSGLLIGLGYIAIAFVVFSALSGSFVFDASLGFDFLLGGIMGGICGIICVNLKKNCV